VRPVVGKQLEQGWLQGDGRGCSAIPPSAPSMAGGDSVMPSLPLQNGAECLLCSIHGQNSSTQERLQNSPWVGLQAHILWGMVRALVRPLAADVSNTGCCGRVDLLTS